MEGKKDKGSLRTDPGLLFSLSGNFRKSHIFQLFNKSYASTKSKLQKID